MKILFLTPQPPSPPDQGTRLRNHHLIRITAEAGHEVHLLTFVPRARGESAAILRCAHRSPLETALARDDRRGTAVGDGAGFERWCRRVERVPAPPSRPILLRAADAGLSNLPDLVTRLWSRQFADAVQRLQAEERYHVVQAEGFEMALYLRLANGARTVFDEHNVEYLLQQSAWETERHSRQRIHAALYSFIQWRRLRRWEAQLCAENDAVLAVSDRDAETLAELSERTVVCVRNGLELSSRPFRAPADDPSPNLLFDGTMSFRPNDDAALWLCREILPLVRQSHPGARCWIVGRDPSRRLTSYNFGHHGVAVTGAVSSTEPYWDRASVYVLPMRMGSGVRFKALEAMARGLPLVSTRLGMEGTGAQPGRDYLPAEEPAEFAWAVARLLDTPPLRRQLAENARRTVAAFDWEELAPGLLRVYERLVPSEAGLVSTGQRE